MKTGFFIAALFVCCLSHAAFGQQAKLEGHILDEKNRPVRAVRIVAPGGQAAETDSRGHFVILFPSSVAPGQATRIKVVRAGWMIYEPMLGNCVTQSTARNYEPLKVVIVRKGSPLALSPRRLSQVIARWADERAKLRGQVRRYKSQLDEYAFLREYAVKYGFTLNQFLETARQWARTKDSEDRGEQALKEYFLKNYDRAAHLAREAALAADADLERINEQRIEAGRKVIRDFKLEGNALSEQDKFMEALRAYEEVDKRFQTRKLSKEDLKTEWAGIKILIGNSKQELGVRVEGQKGQTLLLESVTEYQEALTVFTRESMPEDWAVAQNNLGNTLALYGEQLGGEEGAQRLQQSTEAFRVVLQVFTRKELPEQWAKVQNNIGNVLIIQSDQSEGEEGLRLLQESAEAFHAALQVFTRESAPEDWAAAWNNLGAVLQEQGIRHTGEESVRLLRQSLKAFRSALQVRTPKDLPQDWAMTQHNLGGTLAVLGDRLEGEEGARLLKQAIEAFRASLKVRTREQLPQKWATTQYNLGNALILQSMKFEGEDGVRLRREAVEAFRASLRVFTREHLPQRWEMAQRNLAATYLVLRDWAGAAEAYANILTLHPDDEDAYNRASTLYHESLFEFDKAFSLNQQWLARHPDDISAQADFAEKHFTTGRLNECVQLINALLPRSDVDVSTKTALRAIEIASLLALKQSNQVPVKIVALIEEISRQPADFKVSWLFDGTKQSIGQNKMPSPHSDWLGGLFDALAGKNRDTILNGLQQTALSFKQ